MGIQRVDFRLVAQGGDNPTAAFTKLDGNDADLDARVTATQATAADASTKANAALPAATFYGLGGSAAPRIASFDIVSITRIERFENLATTGTFPPNQIYGTVFTQAYANGSQYTQLALSVTSAEMAFRYYNAGWTAWSRVWHTNNTTVDSNGFIKKAN